MELYNAELFKNLLDVEVNGLDIDLHNDYSCTDILYSEKNLRFKFRKDADGGEFLLIEFVDVDIIKLDLALLSNGLTLDNFHRGRYEIKGELFDEHNGKRCFYLEFYEGGAVELLCKSVILVHPYT